MPNRHEHTISASQHSLQEEDKGKQPTAKGRNQRVTRFFVESKFKGDLCHITSSAST